MKQHHPWMRIYVRICCSMSLSDDYNNQQSECLMLLFFFATWTWFVWTFKVGTWPILPVIPHTWTDWPDETKLLASDHWCAKLTYLVDLFQQLNELNTQMQGRNENRLTSTEKVWGFYKRKYKRKKKAPQGTTCTAWQSWDVSTDRYLEWKWNCRTVQGNLW